MSFVNLMASDVWSDADISNKVQALVRSKYSSEDELKAARLSRKPDISEDELLFISSVDSVISDAIDEGRAARKDNALLIQVLEYENAMRVLANGEDETAQMIVDNADESVKDLYVLRNPVTESLPVLC